MSENKKKIDANSRERVWLKPQDKNLLPVIQGIVADRTGEYTGAMLIALLFLLCENSWTYRTETDAMGRARTFAQVTSTNTVDFSFPYHGPQHATLTLRKTGRRARI